MKLKIAILGAGNLAWNLAPALEDVGHEITEVYARDFQKAKEITERIYTATPKDDLDFSESKAELFILAIKDDALAVVADQVILPEGSILVHTSGAMPMEVLAQSSATYVGVFYPLQSFTKGKKVDFEEVPFLLESEDEGALQLLKKVAKSLSPLVHILRHKDREAVHVAAVFASNFTNHMLRIAEEILHRKGLDREIMKPLIIESISKSLQLGAKKAQTGPAIREDYETLEAHHQFLSYNEQLAEIYRLISQDIIDS
ncbi:MAG: DUF2520 domain-containing protein [Algoriphagus sp.]|jgi:predicted short-subunit dehydrogenase-like oxidoreductase (DUF2520 family)|uniref:Rossmann-like and DUF2520 domain-containing protein n=1 Tax=Algoriphagus sp. TaxID=1872435 RepID=UPI00274DCD42|nr:DUF2520 domain-containing protein [Algoriphagus sp.]MDP4748302.1 DUF2520 domain-containing protein [Algoriphagus sp.]MDP4838549.1 DUF2520 domain-containing protein [Algoriphagus sp.]MDP4904540.1 DUF2520 domain-containing protein [Algoriphagus sp.]MDP4956989.1 DUF2520 domain-containing protein [Algoriphagus sp.]